MSSHAFTGPGDAEPTPFQTKLVAALARFDANYQHFYGRASQGHERNCSALVFIVHVEAQGDLARAKELVDDLFALPLAGEGHSVYERLLSWMAWREQGRQGEYVAPSPKVREMLEREVEAEAAGALRAERERLERIARLEHAWRTAAPGGADRRDSAGPGAGWGSRPGSASTNGSG